MRIMMGGGNTITPCTLPSWSGGSGVAIYTLFVNFTMPLYTISHPGIIAGDFT